MKGQDNLQNTTVNINLYRLSLYLLKLLITLNLITVNRQNRRKLTDNRQSYHPIETIMNQLQKHSILFGHISAVFFLFYFFWFLAFFTRLREYNKTVVERGHAGNFLRGKQ